VPRMLRKYLILSALTLLAMVRMASACTCAPRMTVLEEFETSDEVVILRVVSVEKVDEANKKKYIDGIRSTNMIVQKVFKGSLRVGDEIVFTQGGSGDCIWSFHEQFVGQEFLFYLIRPEKLSDWEPREPGLWSGLQCGRSGRLKHVADDLLYLENLGKVRGKTRISGRISDWSDSDLVVEGIKIRIIGPERSYETKTNRDGVFEIYDLPPGKYLIEPEIPHGWKTDPFLLQRSPSLVRNDHDAIGEPGAMKQIPVLLEAKKHAGVEIMFVIDNSVRGRVIGPKGKPLKGVRVSILRPGQDDGPQLDYTDEEGRFEIRGIPRGDYVLVADHSDKPNKPLRKIFYPNVTERERATVITIGPGDVLENLDIVIP